MDPRQPPALPLISDFDGPDLSAFGDESELLMMDEEPMASPGLEFLVGDEGFEPLDMEQMLPALVPPYDHGENLALKMDERELRTLAQELLQDIEEDQAAHKPWADRFQRGLELMGLDEKALDDGPFAGASSATHPLLFEAVIQFWARVMPEMMPPEGPIKARDMGEQTEEDQDAADRVADFMNFQALVKDPGYYEHKSRSFFQVALMGYSLIKNYFDPVRQRLTGVHVPPEDFAIPANVTDLESAPRYAHRIRRKPSDVRRMMASGFFRTIELKEPDEEDLDETEALKREVSDVETTLLTDKNANFYEQYEAYVERVFDVDPDSSEEGGETGIALPYIIHIDKTSQNILAIYRNYKEEDPLKQPRTYFTKYGCLPGFGFRNFGLVHLIGGLSEAATGALRIMLDGSAMASLSGGFKSKDVNVKGDLTLEPGVWKDVDLTADELASAFHEPPVKEPSDALFQVLGFVEQAGQRASSTTETMVGDADNKAPVGTTIALIEQGSKVFNAIHLGLHRSASQEYRVRFELNAENIPETGYPYLHDGESRMIMAGDFSSSDLILPISDPNISSNTQRMAMAQAAYQVAQENPDIVNRKVAIRRLFQAMKVPDVDALVAPDEEDPPPSDPISETQMLLTGKPIKAYPEQNHMAHIAVHMAFAQNPGFGANEQVQAMVGQALAAHLGEHLAFLFATHARAAGVDAPLIDPKTGMPMQQPSANPEDIAAAMAEIAPMLAQAPGLPAPTMADPNADADAQAKLGQQKLLQSDQAAKQKLEHKDQEHQQKMSHEVDKQALEDIRTEKQMQKDAERQAQQDEMTRNSQMADQALKSLDALNKF